MAIRAHHPLLLLALGACTGAPPAQPDPGSPLTGLDCGEDDPLVLHLDGDGDGHGDPTVSRELCPGTPGWVEDAEDCDDGDAAVSPSAVERCTGRDDDCDGLVDQDDPDVDDPEAEEGWPDADADGWGADGEPVSAACGAAVVSTPGDCDDADPTISPSALEVCANGVDDNCDGAGCSLPVEGQTTDAHLVFASTDPADGTGRAVVALDVDSDGAAELAAGAPWSNAGGFGAGGLAVFAPSAEPWGDVSVEQRGVVTGARDEGALGSSLASGADLDGDGVHDLVATGQGDEAALLFSGASLSASGADPAASLAVTRFTKWAGGGFSAAVAGDLDGDGLADLLLGSSDAVLGAGKVWLIYGEADGWGETVDLDAVDTWVRGDYPGDQLAPHGAAHAHGDYDGDGLADLVLGVPLVHGPGADRGAVVVFWGTGGRLDGPAWAWDADVRLRGPDPEAHFGASAVNLGDVDGDGLPELAVGSPGAEDGAGAVYLFAGSTTRWEDALAGEADSRMVSLDAGARLGASLLAPGDLDGDAVPDLVLGVPTDDLGDSTLGARGSVRVYSGAGMAGAFLSSDALWRVTGDVADARVGSPGSLAAADLNGDGWRDVAIGIPGVGEVAVFYGGGM